MMDEGDALSRLIAGCFLPASAPDSAEHRLVRLYLLATTAIILLLSAFKLLQPAATAASSERALLRLNAAIVDIYIDFDHCHQHRTTGHQLGVFLSQLATAVRQAIHPHPKLVFWCYIHAQKHTRLARSLEHLQSNHSLHGFVHLIDTAQPQLLGRKPLLSDLLKIITSSPPARNYLISSADPDLCTAGLQLAKGHPNSPILSYVPPYGGALPDPIPAVDHLFRWEKDGALGRVDRPEEPRVPSAPPHPDEFEPLVLLLQAHSQSAVPLELVKDYLTPWHNSAAEDPVDQQMAEYIDSAVAHAIISLSAIKPMSENDHSSQIIMVQLRKLSVSSGLDHGVRSPTLSENLPLDEDNLTTTGSELETKSTSGQSSPSPPQNQSSDQRFPPHEVGPSEDDCGNQKAGGELLIKHKYPSSALDTDPLTDRSPKKQKSHTPSSMPLLSPPKPRGGLSSSPKRRSPAKNKHTVALIGSRKVRSSSTGTPPQHERFAKNPDPSLPGTTVDFQFRDHDPRGLGLRTDRRPANGDLTPRPSGSIQPRLPQETRSSLWIHCSSGLTTASTPFVSLNIVHLPHIAHPNPDPGVDAFERIGLGTIHLRLTRIGPPNDEDRVPHHPASPADLPFRHRLIPAFWRISSSPVAGPQHGQLALLPPPLVSADSSTDLDDVD